MEMVDVSNIDRVYAIYAENGTGVPVAVFNLSDYHHAAVSVRIKRI